MRGFIKFLALSIFCVSVTCVHSMPTEENCRFFDKVYSGNASSCSAVTYVYLCSKLERLIGSPENAFVKCIRDNCGPDGCCGKCGTGKLGLFIGAVTVDERNGEFIGINSDTQNVIWSGAVTFVPYTETCCPFYSSMRFFGVYNMAKYLAAEGMSRPYFTNKYDVFCRRKTSAFWLPTDVLGKYPHCMEMNGELSEFISDKVSYFGNGGIFNILHSALFRWKLPQLLTISEFLESVGSVGEMQNGVCMAPRHQGTSIFSGGYNCVSFCDAYLKSMGLLSSQSWLFSSGINSCREDLISSVLSESDVAKNPMRIVHDRASFQNPEPTYGAGCFAFTKRPERVVPGCVFLSK